MEHVKHVGKVGNGLSDNCMGMHGVYNGAMLIFFRDVKSNHKAPQFNTIETAPESPNLMPGLIEHLSRHGDDGTAADAEMGSLRHSPEMRALFEAVSEAPPRG